MRKNVADDQHRNEITPNRERNSKFSGPRPTTIKRLTKRMTDPIWDPSALSEVDRLSYALTYVGPTTTAAHCICGTSSSAAFLIRALVSKLAAPRIGAFEIQVSTITNPGDYANGADKATRPSHTATIPVHQAGSALLIALDAAPKCPHLIAPAIHDAFHAPVTVLDSVHQSLFVGEVTVPSLIVLSASGNDARFGVANSIGGLAAGIATYAVFHRVGYRVLEIVEDDFGASREEFELWLGALTDEVAVGDAEGVVAAACAIAGLRAGTFCGIYS
jgi:hypothetical protein